MTNTGLKIAQVKAAFESNVSLIDHQKERQKAFGRRLAVPRSKFFFARAHTHTHKLMERGQISLSRRATVSSFWPFVCPKDSERKRSAAGAAPIRFHFVDAPEIQRNRARWRLRQKKTNKRSRWRRREKRQKSIGTRTHGWVVLSVCQIDKLIDVTGRGCSGVFVYAPPFPYDHFRQNSHHSKAD